MVSLSSPRVCGEGAEGEGSIRERWYELMHLYPSPRIASAIRTPPRKRGEVKNAVLSPVDPDDAAFFDRQRQPAVFQRKRCFAEQLAAPAVQGGDVALIVGGDLVEVVGGDVLAGDGMAFRTSSAAAPSKFDSPGAVWNCCAACRVSAACGDRGARPRCTAATISLPHFEPVKSFGGERGLARRSSEVGAWVAMSAARIVLEHARRWHVAALCFLLAPGRHFHQHREVLRLAVPRLEPLQARSGWKS